MSALIFDTETTGIPNYKLPVNAPSQPYIVQLAAILTDDDGKVVNSFDLMIKPDNWSIPTDAAAVHGINTELAEKYGLPIEVALNVFERLYRKADFLVAHNIDFDLRMLRRYYANDGECPFLQGMVTPFCTKQAMTEICKLPLTEKQIAAQKRNPGWTPPGGWDTYKAPTQGEAYEFVTGYPLEDAHNAMNDAEACLEVWQYLFDKKLMNDGYYKLR